MGVETEHKFLVRDDSWKTHIHRKVNCRQGYLVADKHKAVRVRMIGKQAFLTVKGSTIGISRPEFEYEIPLADAKALLLLCGTQVIEKTRNYVEHAGMQWEIDVFEGLNAGLVVAEIELVEEGQRFERPEWVGQEVTDDMRYYNACLAKHPYTTWG